MDALRTIAIALLALLALSLAPPPAARTSDLPAAPQTGAVRPADYRFSPQDLKLALGKAKTRPGGLGAPIDTVVVTPGQAPGTGWDPLTRSRPLSDFLSRQGTFCYPDGAEGCRIFNSGMPNFLLWFDGTRARKTAFDYAGLVTGFGTIVTGTVSETEQKDGRALVKIDLTTSNAFTWVVSGFDTATDPVIFGNRIDAVQAGAEPALGSSSFRIEFFNPAMGAPLPDLVQLLSFSPHGGIGPRYLTFTSDSFGELHSAFGVTEGTAGEAIVTMLNLQMNGPGPNVPVDNIMVNVVN